MYLALADLGFFVCVCGCFKKNLFYSLTVYLGMFLIEFFYECAEVILVYWAIFLKQQFSYEQGRNAFKKLSFYDF
jgi:hypothetical protein